MRTIIITGSTGDLGRVVVPRLQRDYRCLTPRRGEPLDFEPPIYALVHLIGGFAPGNDFDAMLATNLMPAVHAVTKLGPQVSRMIAISSIAARTRPAGLGAYAASKAAMEAYLETAAKEYGFTLHILQPGTLDTDEKRAAVAEQIASLLAGDV